MYGNGGKQLGFAKINEVAYSPDKNGELKQLMRLVEKDLRLFLHGRADGEILDDYLKKKGLFGVQFNDDLGVKISIKFRFKNSLLNFQNSTKLPKNLDYILRFSNHGYMNTWKTDRIRASKVVSSGPRNQENSIFHRSLCLIYMQNSIDRNFIGIVGKNRTKLPDTMMQVIFSDSVTCEFISY